jgi:FkbM family methyltransferase
LWFERHNQAHLARTWAAIAGTKAYRDITVIGRARLRLYGDCELGHAICCVGFEANELQFLHRFIKPGDFFVDVGANIGLFTVAAGCLVGREGSVLAFEPGRLARSRLEENVHLNRLRSVTISPLALSNASGQAQLFVPGNGKHALGSLGRPISGSVAAAEAVETKTLDEVLEALTPARVVTMVKLDVEGWETRVLEGASSLLGRSDAPLLQVEFTEAAAKGAGKSCRDLYRQLSGAGFCVCRFEAGKNCLVPDSLREDYLHVNLFATKCPDAVNAKLARSSAGRRLFAPPVYRA